MLKQNTNHTVAASKLGGNAFFMVALFVFVFYFDLAKSYFVEKSLNSAKKAVPLAKIGAAAGIRTRVVGSGSRSPNQVFQLAHFALISRLRPPQTS